MKKQLKLIISSMISLVLVIVCLTVCAFAWFVSNTKINNNAMLIEVSANTIDASYIIYKYDGGNVIQSQSLSMAEYDSIITARNAHNPIIIELTISGVAIETNSILNLDIHCTDTNLNTMSLSNVLFFKSNFLTINAQDNEDLYTQASTQLNSAAARQFVSNTKNQIISITLSNYQNYKITENTVKYYIKIDYEPDLVADLVSLDFSSLDTFNTIVFNPDITKIEIYEVSN